MDRSCLGRATTDENDQVIAENHAHITHQKLLSNIILLHLNKLVILHCLIIILILCKRVDKMGQK